jgi:ketosteroid isomerase-like protein
VFRLRDGKIVEWRPIYWDTHAVREACGAPEA